MKLRALVKHPIYEEALGMQEALILKDSPGSLFRLVGPAGVGKSEVGISIARSLAGPLEAWTPQTLPVAIVRSRKVEQGRFSPKWFAGAVYTAVNSPDVRWAESKEAGFADLLNESMESRRSGIASLRKRGKDPVEHELRDAAQEHLASRQTKLLIIEDAHTMTAASRLDDPADYINPWVALAEEVGTKVLFVGTGAMLRLWDAENEFNRRSPIVFMDRYDVEDPIHRRQFAGLVYKAAERYRWKSASLLRKEMESLYFFTLGCVAHLIKLLDVAEAHAKTMGRDAIEACDLRSAAPTRDQLQHQWDAIRRFEKDSQRATLEEAKKMVLGADCRGRSQ